MNDSETSLSAFRNKIKLWMNNKNEHTIGLSNEFHNMSQISYYHKNISLEQYILENFILK